MKKNVILGILATVFAVGSAFASFLSPIPVFVRAKTSSTAPFTCQPANVTCESTGTFTCLVEVQTQLGTKTVNGRNSDCSAILKNTTAAAIDSPIDTYYDVAN